MKAVEASRLQLLLVSAAWIASVPNAATVLKFYHSPAAGGAWTALGLSFGGWLFILTVTFALLLALCLPFWGRWVKIPCAFALVSAAALGFFTTFMGTQFDKTMMASIAQTHWTEAIELTHWRLVLWVGLVGILPAILVARVTLRPMNAWPSVWKALATLFALVGITSATVFAQYSRHATTIRNRHVSFDSVSPANVVISGLHTLVAERMASTVRTVKGVDAHQGYPIARARLLVLVIGETARAANHGLNGYERDTTPRMRAAGGYYFPDTESCGTATAISVPCIFSGLGRNEFTLLRGRQNETLIDVVARSKARVIWLDNDAGCKDVCGRAELTDMSGSNDPRWCPEPAECHDEILLDGLEQRLRAQQRDTLAVLHLKGSHGPAYFKRYPKAFERFSPVCATSDLSACDQQALRNAYDNTILYTDHVIGETIRTLQALSDRYATALLYVSDHGESLGESGLYLHGMPYALAPKEQTRVPMFAWVSPQFLALERWDSACMARQTQRLRSHDNVYATVLGFMEVESVEYKPELDIFDACDPPRK